MAKRARQFLTPELRRTYITLALEGAGIARPVSYAVACAVEKMPINGTHNQRAMSKAIADELPRAKARHEAWLVSPIEPVAHPRGGLRLILGGAR